MRLFSKLLVCMAVVVLMASLASAASAHLLLVSPSGQPVGGQMQQWVDSARVPVVSGRITLVSSASLCLANAASCMQGPPWHGTSYLLAANDRQGLYFELGHLFDWRYLTGKDRRWLARQWQEWGVPWVDSDLAIRQGTEDGLEGAFAAIYQSCAMDPHADIAGLVLMGSPTSTVEPAGAMPRSARSTCAFIRFGRPR